MSFDSNGNAFTSALQELGWGETPWDDMSQEQILREVQRMYAALVAVRGPMKNAQRSEPNHPYWNESGGVGHDALRMLEMALEPYPDEPAYRSFFRYANDLLFSPELGANWMVCENGDLVGSFIGTPPTVCTLCRANGKGEVSMRSLTWDDLKRTGNETPPSCLVWRTRMTSRRLPEWRWLDWVVFAIEARCTMVRFSEFFDESALSFLP